MDQVVDRPETETCAKWTLRGVLRTGALLAAAVIASVLLVDPPIPASLATGGPAATQSYVPASDKWIELGNPQPAEAPSGPQRLQADLLDRAAAVDPEVVPRPKARGAQLARAGRDGTPHRTW